MEHWVTFFLRCWTVGGKGVNGPFHWLNLILSNLEREFNAVFIPGSIIPGTGTWDVSSKVCLTPSQNSPEDQLLLACRASSLYSHVVCAPPIPPASPTGHSRGSWCHTPGQAAEHWLLGPLLSHLIHSLFKIYFYFLFKYMALVCKHLEARRECDIPLTWSYRQLWTACWVW